MPKLIANAKIFSLGGEMWVTDENEKPRYTIKASFMKIPKHFTILDNEGNTRAVVTRKMLSMMPKFFLEVDGQEVATLSQKATLMRKKFEVEAKNIQLQGNIWDYSFEVLREGQLIGKIDKSWTSARDKYMIEIESQEDEVLVLGLVLAVNYVKAEEDMLLLSSV
ncbi:MAG: LURP-one-related family protein [Streptococcaceae bacterium]|jgi:uncharacterized protein YxjI|nr:LURP-one-related family protein [Streptococcaceae bacterium]